MPAQLQKTTLVRKQNVQPRWFTVDAQDQILGRLATQIAMVLMGKHRPDYTPNVVTGDFVIVTNAEKVAVTGKKADTKTYEHYTYHFSGRKIVSYQEMMAKRPEKIITEAVRRMLPKNKLGREMIKHLKVYAGGNHPHAAQCPEKLDVN